jgi:hypothetical protein
MKAWHRDDLFKEHSRLATLRRTTYKPTMIQTLGLMIYHRARGFVDSRTSGVSPVGIEFPCQ